MRVGVQFIKHLNIFNFLNRAEQMNRKILMLEILLLSSSLIIAQKLNYNEVLQKTKNIQSAYLNENSMLLKMSSKKIKLFNFTTNKEKEINLPIFYGNIQQTKYDQYFIRYSMGEFDNKGVLIDKDGNKKELQLSTGNAKISEDGRYIITTKKTALGDGQFQIINAETMENQNTPKRRYNSFGAEFIDSNKVFLLYQNMTRQFNESARDSIDHEYRRLFKNKNNSETELKKLRKERRDKLRKYEKREITTKYLIYNISTQEVEYETELIIDSKKYNYYENRIRIAVSDNKQKVLLSAYLVTNKKNFQPNNRLLEIDLLNYELKNISDKIDHGEYDQIFEISFLNNNEFSIMVSNKGVVKYYYFRDKKVFRTEYKVTGKFRYGGNLITKGEENIVIIDPVNKMFIWDYKNNNGIEIYNDRYPVHLRNNKIEKIVEVQK